jgi:hypothetical protein
MSFEGHEAVFYDSNENLNFRNALVDLTRTAYDTAHKIDEAESKYENTTGDLLVADAKIEIDGERSEYSFYAEKGDAAVEIQAIAFTGVNAPTDEAVRLIHDEMREADIHREMKYRFSYDFEEVRRAQIESFVRRHFFIQLDTGDVSIRTDMGYAVDEIEINGSSETLVPTDLDVARERIFERDDFREFMQALHTLGLVNDEQIKQFLNRF